MATNLPNRATVTYTYGTNTDTAVSNQTNTTLLDLYTMNLEKTAMNTTVTAGENAGYTLSLENNGSGTLYNPIITDNLGGGISTAPRLSYITGSAQYFLNGSPVSGNASSTGTGISFSVPTIFQPGDYLTVTYLARVPETASGVLTNTATATANSGSATGAAVTDTDTAVITVETAANICIFKSADKTSVVSGETLTYTFTLMNSGAQAADSITFVDALPPEFTVTSVSYTQNGITVNVPSTDYTITAPNTLTIPAAGSSLVIGVPAADATGSGITTITVTGTVSNI